MYTVFGAVGLAGYYVQSQRSPEQVIKEEKPSSESTVTRKSVEQIAYALDSVAEATGMRLYKAGKYQRLYDNRPSIFSWRYVIRIEIEEPNDWSRKVTIHIYNQAEQGYGNRLRRKRKLSKVLELMRETLKNS